MLGSQSFGILYCIYQLVVERFHGLRRAPEPPNSIWQRGLIWQSRSLSNIQQKAPLLEAFKILNVLHKGLNCLASDH